MKKYKISIEEHVSDSFEIEAENEGTAVKEAIRKYKNGEFVLEPGYVTNRLICIDRKENGTSEWFKF